MKTTRITTAIVVTAITYGGLAAASASADVWCSQVEQEEFDLGVPEPPDDPDPLPQEVLDNWDDLWSGGDVGDEFGIVTASVLYNPDTGDFVILGTGGLDPSIMQVIEYESRVHEVTHHHVGALVEAAEPLSDGESVTVVLEAPDGSVVIVTVWATPSAQDILEMGTEECEL